MLVKHEITIVMERVRVRYSAEQKREARARIAAASGRAFRRHGFGGVGVDGLAKEAGVTSGAFYGHFKSKDDAFREIAVAGLQDLAATIRQLQADHGEAWIATFVDFYLGERRTCDLAESCALQSLTPDVMRADEATRSAYEAVFGEVVDAVAAGLQRMSDADRQQSARALLAVLSGGVTLARSMVSPDASAQVAQAIRAAALSMVR